MGAEDAWLAGESIACRLAGWLETMLGDRGDAEAGAEPESQHSSHSVVAG